MNKFEEDRLSVHNIPGIKEIIQHAGYKGNHTADRSHGYQ